MKRPLLDTEDALEQVTANTPRGRARVVALEDAAGLVLSAPILAATDQPPFPRSLMDGFAVRAVDDGCCVRCVGEVAAGMVPDMRVDPGTGVEIMTGAFCPPGSELVVKVEDVKRSGDHVELPAGLTRGQHLIQQGELCRAGEQVLPAGARLTPLAIGAAAGLGVSAVHVWERPTVAIITTGGELRRAGETLEAAQIHDANGPMLAAMARSAGAEVVLMLHAEDTPESLYAMIERAGEADILVFSGGVSMGRYDIVPEVLEAMGARLVFHKVRQKPGKPLLFAVAESQLIFGLPGTPLGSHLGFHRYVTAAIRGMTGRRVAVVPRVGRLACPLSYRSGRTLFRLARAGRSEGHWTVEPLRWRYSIDLVGPAMANSYIHLPDGEWDLERDEEVAFELIEEGL